MVDIIEKKQTGKTILIVDDSSTMRKIISRELEEFGHTVLTAVNGMEALAMIEWMSKKPDLITLDIDMPVMNGFAVCEHLLEKQKKAGVVPVISIPIIFVSSNDTLSNRRKGFQYGVSDFLAKPFRPREIVRVVNNVLYPRNQFQGMTALIVDDSSSARRIMQTILMRIGVSVLTASNGVEALEVIEYYKGPLDLIITDYMMPEMRGDELCKLIRQNPALKQVPIFVVSAFDDMDLILRLFKAGATDYLSKPFIEEELLARVEIHLRVHLYVNQIEDLNFKLAHLASRDGLTGLYNRRYFQEHFELEFTSAVRRNQDLSCIILDLDFFKKINDNCGHAFGDKVLRDFADILQNNASQNYICARYGGEEFVVVLPHAGFESAISFAEKVRAAVEEHVCRDSQKECRITCSVGVASLKTHNPENADRLVGMADLALYSAKDNGRNQVQGYAVQEGLLDVSEPS